MIGATGATAVSDEGVELVAGFEGFRGVAYLDQVKRWTVGYGETWLSGRRVREGDTLNQAEAHVLLKTRLRRDYAPAVIVATKNGPPLTQNQFDALASLAYNIGGAALIKSTLGRQYRKGLVKEAADSFLSWTKAGGRKLRDLEVRRKKERELFLTPDGPTAVA
jgi:lysozyme